MASEFKVTRRVEFSETDMAGIVHFTNFFRYMESAEHAFYRSLGLTVDAERGGFGWPRVQASCDYRQPLRFEEEFEVHLRVAEVRTKAIRYEFLFRRGDTEIATGRLTVVCVKKVNGEMQAVAIPAEVRAKIEPWGK
jgi:YbgC/YbaW family acyl-CoA thioester hydrolase